MRIIRFIIACLITWLLIKLCNSCVSYKGLGRCPAYAYIVEEVECNTIFPIISINKGVSIHYSDVCYDPGEIIEIIPTGKCFYIYKRKPI